MEEWIHIWLIPNKLEIDHKNYVNIQTDLTVLWEGIHISLGKILQEFINLYLLEEDII